VATELPDWVRLQKALFVEAKEGFPDLMGNRYRFSEFLCLSFGKTPDALIPAERRQWQEIAMAFTAYPQMSFSERQYLVELTSKFLQQLKQDTQRRSLEGLSGSQSRNFSAPPTKRVSENPNLTLDLPLVEFEAVGRRKSDYLARLGLHKVRDLLYYYPRDHIDYARQVNINQVETGETVTVVGIIKRCNCFTSPRNKKLTILDVVLQDTTGQIKLNRFFAGTRYNNRSWQEQLKRWYPVGSIVAASGLVKKNKYGISLDNPEMEVLDGAGGSIESIKIGRVVPVYPLTEGVPADLVRQAVLAVLSCANQLKEPLPRVLREQYGDRKSVV
jgi:ATP-dependent DNA helicase RecG